MNPTKAIIGGVIGLIVAVAVQMLCGYNGITLGPGLSFMLGAMCGGVGTVIGMSMQDDF